MLIHEYSTYKIWESDQQERGIRLSRLVDARDVRATPSRHTWLGLLLSKLSGLH
ncbi:hypothetical protein [Cohnella lupini]|uniref:Uncharacterized protein n=1 Tax=Cohnella lupini TaxID=1294267 RepID=A0A3D9I4R2_9BACL|nr:hypothetical protein [Cohnella lupini]RED56747.1 hypothetical protein DFP95_11238 [Cohnella lupini]